MTLQEALSLATSTSCKAYGQAAIPIQHVQMLRMLYGVL